MRIPEFYNSFPLFWDAGSGSIETFSAENSLQAGYRQSNIVVDMATKRDGLRMWWSKFEQMETLAELLNKSVSSLVDEYIAASPVHTHRRNPIGFEEYVMNRAAMEKASLLRDYATHFFELMDTSSLIEGNKSSRSRDSWIRVAPLIPPLAGSESVAGIVFDELVRGSDNPKEITLERFIEYVQVRRKTLASLESGSDLRSSVAIQILLIYTHYAAGAL